MCGASIGIAKLLQENIISSVQVLVEVELCLAWQELQAYCGVGLAALIFSDDSGNAREPHGRFHLFSFLPLPFF